jgi:hypothetical protein
MAAFKDEIGGALVRALAAELVRAWPAFPRQRFTRGIAAAVEPLELLARVDLVAERLAATLPAPFPDAADVLWRALESPSFAGWMTLPCGGPRIIDCPQFQQCVRTVSGDVGARGAPMSS